MSKGKYGDLINQARNPEPQKPIEPENHKVELVNLCIKVPRTVRHHWAIEAKKAEISMTEVMVAALEARFGLPDNQK